MNIENITSLTEQLRLLGFENAGSRLIKRTCFKPASFFLSYKIEKSKDQLSFQLFFEKDKERSLYVLKYYDVLLQKEFIISDAIINGINIATLEKRIAEIDWKNAFDLDIKKQWTLEDKACLDNVHKIEIVIEDLLTLESIEDGKQISVGLKLKYWADISHQEFVGHIGTLKNKNCINQRFYFFEGQAGISADEAYRFLQNRWLQKQMQSKSKPANDEIGNNGSQLKNKTSAHVGVFRKRKMNKQNI